MEFTGERAIPEVNKDSFLFEEHVARYCYASNYCEGKTVLDIACGSGYGSDILSNSATSVIGVDISDEAINYCKDKYQNSKKIEFFQGEVKKIPLAEKSVDVVVSFETIEHVDELEQKEFLTETKRVLKEKGLFICSTPNTNNTPRGNEFHKNELDPETFQAMLANYFKNVKLYYQDLLAASYFVKKRTDWASGIINQEQVDLEKSKFLVAVCSDKRVNSNEYLYFGKLKPKDVEYSLKSRLNQKQQLGFWGKLKKSLNSTKNNTGEGK